MSIRTGQCLCGQVKFRLAAEPLVSRICWCRDCQHIAGNGTANAIFPSEAIEVTGEVRTYESRADSGNLVSRRFCLNCGSHLFADNTGRPGLTVVRLGTLDDPSSVKPSSNIWTSSAPSWACFANGIEQVAKQPAAPQPQK